MTARASFFPLGGGLDLVTPAIATKPGVAVAALNYEPVMSGYRRIRGYERFDGQVAPSSDFRIYRIDFANAVVSSTLEDAVGTRIYQLDPDPDARRAFVVTLPVIDSGTIGGANTGHMYVVQHTNPVDEGIATFSGDVIVGNIVSTSDDLSGIADLAAAQEIARDVLRAEIEAVPGTGPVRGVWFWRGKAFAIRNFDSGQARVYTSSLDASASVGWSVLPFAKQIAFTNGVNEPVLGALLHRGASAARLGRIEVTSGDWGAGTAAGIAYLYSQTAAWSAGTVTNGAATTYFTVAGDSTTFTLAINGRYTFITENFYGSEDLERVYAAGGVDMALDIDERAVYPISTGMAIDTPTRVSSYKNHLFLSFTGGSVQHSEPGEPRVWNPLVGAGEIGIGDEITDFLPVPSALAILGEDTINALYGNDESDFTLEQVNDEAGALPYTAQRIGEAVYMDNRGLRSLKASQAFGNFSIGTLSQMIEPLLNDYRRDQVNPTASLLARARGQYWVFFDNGTALACFFGKKYPEILPVNLGLNVTCAASVEDRGEERLFIGCDDGFVYELDKGNSFDGESIEHYVRLAFNHFGAPQMIKRIHKVTFDLEVPDQTTLWASVDIDYGAVPGTEPQQLVLTVGGGAALDDLGSNELYYASQVETIAEAYVNGEGKNFSLKISGDTVNEEPHTLTGATFHISPRGERQ